MPYGLNIVPVHGYRVEAEPIDGNISAIVAVDQSADGGIAWKGATAGRPVEVANVPTRMKWLDRNKHSIPDFDNNLLLNVSERVKDIVERFEPGVHQFLPVTYLDKDDIEAERRYFLFVCKRVDGVDREATTLALHNGLWQPVSNLVRRGNPLPPGADPAAKPKLIFSRDAIGQHHLWRDKHLLAGPFVSDELAASFRNAGLTGLKLEEASKVEVA